MKRLIWLVALVALLATGCASKGESVSVGSITVSGAWSRAAMAMGAMEGGASNGAAFMLIKNNGDTADRLVKVESDAALAVEIHKTEMKDDVMSMSPVDYVEIPAKGEFELKSGGYHVMLLGLKDDLKAGGKVHLKLYFEKAGTLEVDAEVRE